MAHRDVVAELAGETVGTVNHLSVDYDAASDTGTEGNHYKVLHTLGDTVGHLSHGSRIGVVGKGYGDASAGLGKLLGELDFTVGGPRKIGCIGYAAGIVVAVRGAYAYTADLPVLAGLGHQLDDGLGKFLDDNICVRAAVCRHDALGENLATCIDHAELAALAADVNSYNEIFTHIVSLP